jgi:hypothetical protein
MMLQCTYLQCPISAAAYGSVKEQAFATFSDPMVQRFVRRTT